MFSSSEMNFVGFISLTLITTGKHKGSCQAPDTHLRSHFFICSPELAPGRPPM